MEKLFIHDTTKINDFKEVDNLELSTITRNEGDKELLSGLIISGFEMKFGKVNENWEMFEPTCIDDYMQDYFVKNKLNVPVTLLHKDDVYHLAGRVLVVQTSTTGFYFTVYIPKTFVNYELTRNLIKEGILQGFSKEGWADEYEVKYTKDGSFDYILIKKMTFIYLSIVGTPANGIRFDKIKETPDIRNTTTFVKIEDIAKPKEKENELENLLFNS